MLLKLLVLFPLTAFATLGQSPQHRHLNSARTGHSYSFSKTKPSELVRLAQKLRARGLTVVLTKEKISQPFFSVPGRIMKINVEAVQVFEYGTTAAANANAREVSADGGTIGTSKPSWIASPHFFKSGRLIVLYVGEDQSIIDVLRLALGNQFAGR